MNILQNLSESDITDFLKSFIEYFHNGYEFEFFLKEFLYKIGLDEIQLTQKSKDGGYDLTAIRHGIGKISNNDKTNYLIQAKKYNIKNPIGVSTVRELRGVIPPGYKGIIITTSHFTKDAIIEAENDISRPIVLIDGKKLITTCIELEIGFIYKPVFSTHIMDKIMSLHQADNQKSHPIKTDNFNPIYKEITQNDIRAKIISIPKAIAQNLSDEKINVVINNDNKYNLHYNSTRNYLSGVTTIFKQYGLINEDGIINPMQASWIYDQKNKTIFLEIENQKNS